MATKLKASQIDSGILANQVPVVSTAYKFTGSLTSGGTTTLTLPAGTDPTLLIADITILDTFSDPSAPTYNWWVPGDVAITLAKTATQIKLVNETTNTVQYTVVLR